MTENNLKPYVIGQKLALYDPATQKFLLLKANKPQSKNGKGDDKKYEAFWKTYFPWDLPGGRIEEGETVEAGFTRDVVEEIGEAVHYTLQSIIHTEHMEYLDGPVYATFTLGTYQGGEITLSEEHSEYSWMAAEEVESNKDVKPWLKTVIKNSSERLKEQSYLTDLVRLQADFENYKKREAEGKKELGSYLTERVIADITPVLDNFYQAVSFVPEDQKESPFIMGIMYIQKQLEDALKNHGLTIIQTKEGDLFDPKIHEAVEGSGDTITKVREPGYKLGERVIKPARVNV
jgi:molecular chaperone GrpE